MWKQHDSFMGIVKNAWNKQFIGNKMYVVVQKMKALKYDLRSLNREKFHDVEKPELFVTQQNMNNDHGNLLLQGKEKVLSKEFRGTSLALESFYKKKSKGIGLSWETKMHSVSLPH